MKRSWIFLVLAVAAAYWSFSARRARPLVADPPVVKSLAGWGDAWDPRNDCQFKAEDGTLTIDVPGTVHGLSVQLNEMSAPRVMREVEGDFVATVHVAGTFHPSGMASQRHLPYNGAGLVVWQDSNNYIRFERAAIMREGQLQPYLNLERWSNGRQVSSTPTVCANAPVTLRLERQGNQIQASFSTDGRQWAPLLPTRVSLKPHLRIGVAAINAAKNPFAPEFSHFELTGPSVKDADK